MNLLIIVNILIFAAYDVYGNEICSPLDGIDRTCMRYQDCPKNILDLIAATPMLPSTLKLLRDARCGARSSRKLCCPTPECYTWDGRPGVCVEYNDSVFTETMTFRQIRVSRCIDKPSKFVCYSHLRIRQTSNCELDDTGFPPDPSLGCCGKDRVARDKITEGGATTIDEFPWLAVIKYPEDKRNCTGALISRKYVLTAANCVVPNTLHNKPYAIVLGEYNKRTTNDCDQDECHDTTVTIKIEDIKVHADFNLSNPLRKNDIALIRLEETVTYSDFIQPICLPIDFRDTTKFPPENFKLWSAGWGSADVDNPRPSDVKLKAELPFVNSLHCAESHPQLLTSQMCAGAEDIKDRCISDSGAPLMYDRDGTFEVLGITTSSITACSTDRLPLIYTKVYTYSNWIHSTIRP